MIVRALLTWWRWLGPQKKRRIDPISPPRYWPGRTGEIPASPVVAKFGLAYNPRTNRWRLLPGMAYPRFGFAAVWTGQQLLVWGGLTAKRVPPPHGEAYNPATNKWTSLPASPLRGRANPVAVWNHRRMFVWGGALPNGRSFTDGAVFTPAR